MTKRKAKAQPEPEYEEIPSTLTTNHKVINKVVFTEGYRKRVSGGYWFGGYEPAGIVLSKDSDSEKWTITATGSMSIAVVSLTTEEAEEFFNKCLDMLSIVGDS